MDQGSKIHVYCPLHGLTVGEYINMEMPGDNKPGFWRRLWFRVTFRKVVRHWQVTDVSDHDNFVIRR